MSVESGGVRFRLTDMNSKAEFCIDVEVDGELRRNQYVLPVDEARRFLDKCLHEIYRSRK